MKTQEIIISDENTIKEGWDCRTLNDIMAEVHRIKHQENDKNDRFVDLLCAGDQLQEAAYAEGGTRRDILIKVAAVIIRELEGLR